MSHLYEVHETMYNVVEISDQLLPSSSSISWSLIVSPKSMNTSKINYKLYTAVYLNNETVSTEFSI
jgi:hypothetical protein